jgi:hypothetical protein
MRRVSYEAVCIFLYGYPDEQVWKIIAIDLYVLNYYEMEK